jgi:hypothetical protein
MNGQWGSKKHDGQGRIMLWSRHVKGMSVRSVVLLLPNEERRGIGHMQEKWNDEWHSEREQRRPMSSAEYDPMV